MNGIYIDSKNNTWIYHSYGLDKFDGKNWEYDIQKSAAPNSNAIYQIIEDEKNNLWFVTDIDGFIRYDGKNWVAINKWKYNTMSNEFPRWKSRRLFIDKKTKKLNCIFQDMDSVIYEFQDDNYWKMEIETFEISKQINDSFTQDSTILYISSKQGIIKKNGKNIKFLRADKSILSNSISSIFIDSKERIWISSKLDELSDGVVVISKNDWKKYNDLVQPSNVQFRDAFLISEDLKGNIWVGNYRDYGMYKFNGLEWQQFGIKTTNSKISNNTICFYQDSKNMIWVGHSWGMSKFDGRNWTLIRLLDSKDYIIDNLRNGETGVFQIVEDRQGVIWAATLGGLLKYKGNELSIWNTNNKRIPNNRVSSIFLDSSDRLIIVTEKEMYYFKNNAWQNIPLPNVSVKITTQSKNKELFFISDRGEIYKLIDNQWQIVINNLEKNVYESEITSFFVDESNFWIGTSYNGVFKIKR